MEEREKRRSEISVRTLVEFLLRSGDIDRRGGAGGDQEAMLAGSWLHRRIQKSSGKDYQAEVPLSEELDCGSFFLKVEGRADGIFSTSAQPFAMKAAETAALGALDGTLRILAGKPQSPEEKRDPEEKEAFGEADPSAPPVPGENAPGGSLAPEIPGGPGDGAEPSGKGHLPKMLTVVDEIKGMYQEPSKLDAPLPVHLAQAKCYAAMLAFAEELPAVGVTMTYAQLENEHLRRFYYLFNMEELRSWFLALIGDWRKWVEWKLDWEDVRDSSMEALTFPYPYREGQRALVASVYRTIERRGQLFLMAPTGTGKTLATVYPAVRSLREGHSKRIFYLAAKNQTLSVGWEAFALLRERGLRLKTVRITAREKACFLSEPACDPERCPYARGHFDRINDTVFALLNGFSANAFSEGPGAPALAVQDLRPGLSSEGIGREGVPSGDSSLEPGGSGLPPAVSDAFGLERIREAAEAARVCPFELALDLSTWCDAILGDYNYAFAPHAYLRRFFGEGGDRSSVLLIDEAHNLVSRGREMYSSILYKKDVLAARKLLKDAGPRAARALAKLNRVLLALQKLLPKEEAGQPENPANVLVLWPEPLARVWEERRKKYALAEAAPSGEARESAETSASPAGKASGEDSEDRDGSLYVQTSLFDREEIGEREDPRSNGGASEDFPEDREAFRGPGQAGDTFQDLGQAGEASAGEGLRQSLHRLQKELAEAAILARNELDAFFRKERGSKLRDELLDFYFSLRDFTDNLGALEEDCILCGAFDEEKHFYMELLCADPSRRLSEMADRAAASVFFSATLLPIDYYRRFLTTRENVPAIYAKSAFDAENRLVLIGRGVTTRFRSRGTAMYRRIASCIRELARGKCGNYMVFFPSYKLLSEVLKIYREEYDEKGINYVAQGRGMSELDREIFLENFYEDPKETLVGFCVMGGIFAEGIDLTGTRLIGAVIVGTGLPQLSIQRELLREYFSLPEEAAPGGEEPGRSESSAGEPGAEDREPLPGSPDAVSPESRPGRRSSEDREPLPGSPDALSPESRPGRRSFGAGGLDGFAAAYQIPGMNKVQQAAGRVIRTGYDRGVILLLDDRFLEPSSRQMFPREWTDVRICREEDLAGVLKEFWGEDRRLPSFLVTGPGLCYDAFVQGRSEDPARPLKTVSEGGIHGYCGKDSGDRWQGAVGPEAS